MVRQQITLLTQGTLPVRMILMVMIHHDPTSKAVHQDEVNPAYKVRLEDNVIHTD